MRAVEAGGDDEIDEAGVAFAQRAGFVEDSGVDGGEVFDGVSAAGEESAFGQRGQRGPEGDGRGEAHGARAGDEEDGEAVEDAGDPAAVERPTDGGEGGDDEDEREEPRDEAVGFALDAAGICAGFLDGLEEGVEAAGASARGGGEAQGAVFDATAGEDGIAGAFDHGVGLAGERGFADQGHAIGHASVDGDALAGADEDLVARRDAIDGDAFAVAGGVDAFAKIEGGADFFDGTAEGIAALSGEDRAERVNGDEDGDDLVVDGAGRGERAMHGGKECAEDAEEKELLEDDASVAEGVPRFAQDGETSEKKNTEGGEGEGAVDDPAGLAGDGREVDGEAEDHGLRGEKPGHAEAEPVARLVVEEGLIGCVVAGAVAAG